MDQTFRPAPVDTGPEDTNIVRGDGGDSVPNVVVDVPLSQYQAVKQVPFTAEFFELEDYGFLNDLTDVDDIRSNVKIIEEYVYHQISSKDLYDTTDTYKDILNEIFEKIGIDKNERMSARLSKTAKYIELLSRSKTTEQRRRELLKRQQDEERRLESLKSKLLKTNEAIKNL